MADLSNYYRPDSRDVNPSPINSSAVQTGYSGGVSSAMNSGYSGTGSDAMTNAIANYQPNQDWANKGVPDDMTKAIEDYHKLMAKPGGHPLENFLGGVDDQESYRPAMMQYVASGGKRPAWYTGNYEKDKSNIDTAINATMTPEQQMKRQEAQTKQQDLQETRAARITAVDRAATDKEKESASKREALAQKAMTVHREDRIGAHNVLVGALGPDYLTTPSNITDAISERIASAAKAKRGTPEAEGLSTEELMQDEVNSMIARGELKLPEKGNYLGNLTHGIIGTQSSPAQFNRQGTQPTAAPTEPAAAPTEPAAAPAPIVAAAPSAGPTDKAKDWIARAQASPRNKGYTLEQIIAEGKKRGKIP
jgi:hypothetical protein